MERIFKYKSNGTYEMDEPQSIGGVEYYRHEWAEYIKEGKKYLITYRRIYELGEDQGCVSGKLIYWAVGELPLLKKGRHKICPADEVECFF